MEHNLPVQDLDEWALALYLEVPQDKIVILQAFLESYEGIGTVRTVDEPTASEMKLVSVISTRDTLSDCMSALEALKPLVPWRLAAAPTVE